MYSILKNYNSGVFTNLIDDLRQVYKEVKDTQKQEAASVGLTLISKSTKLNYNFYKFNNCGHTGYLQPTHVRRAAFKCDSCFIMNTAKTLYNMGDFFVHRSGPAKYNIIKRCGHSGEVFKGYLNKTTEWCEDCFETTLKESAYINGYIYVSKQGKGYRLIKFKDCGHEKSVHQTQIIKGNIVCSQCKDDRHLLSIQGNGLSLLERVNDRYAFYQLPCGCSKKIRVDHAEQGSWQCNNCDESHFNKPSSVYLIMITSNDLSWLKLGYSKNLNFRLNSYGLSADASIRILAEKNFSKGVDALHFEKMLHCKFKKYRLDRVKMKELHKHSGFTECYPIALLDNLVENIVDNNNNYSS